MSAAYTPVMSELGEMPLETGVSTINPVKVDGELLPSDVYEIQVYAFISVQGGQLDGVHRGYYEIFTKKSDNSELYTNYMNVASVKDSIVNSINCWLPYGEGIDPIVWVRLVSGDDSSSGDSASAKGKGIILNKPVKKSYKKHDLKEYARQRPSDDEEIVGQLFLTGYRRKAAN